MKTVFTQDLDLASNFLLREEVVAFPTETVYGLGARVFSDKAVRKIFSIKGRPSDNPLIVHIAHMEEVHVLAKDLPPLFYPLAKRFWPGPLTLIVAKKTEVSSLVSAGLESVAIRMPSHPMARALIEKVKEPIVAPSANLSGKPSPTSAQEVFEDLSGKIPLIVDGGVCFFGMESTVVSLLDPKKPKLLRKGSLSKEEIEEVCPLFLPEERDIQASPGMRHRHYAPNGSIRLVYKESELRSSFILSRVPIEGKKTLFFDQRSFYSKLRCADREGISEIEIYVDRDLESDLTLMDRISRAAGNS